MEGLKVIVFFGYRLVDWYYHSSVILYGRMQTSLVCHDILVVFNLQTHILIQLRVNWTTCIFVTEYLHKVQFIVLHVHVYACFLGGVLTKAAEGGVRGRAWEQRRLVQRVECVEARKYSRLSYSSPIVKHIGTCVCMQVAIPHEYH